MKRRSFIAAAVGLLGGWFVGPKVFGAVLTSESLAKPLPSYLSHLDLTYTGKVGHWEVFDQFHKGQFVRRVVRFNNEIFELVPIKLPRTKNLKEQS